MRRAATRAFIGEHQNISNKNATLRKINSNNRLPSNYTEHTEVYSHDTKPSLWRKPLGQIGPVIKLKVTQSSIDQFDRPVRDAINEKFSLSTNFMF